MIAFAVLAALMLASAALAFALRNLIHSALLLILTWAGVAGFYLWAGAEFVAFAQLLIYVGAVSMVVLFAVLLTRRGNTDPVIERSSVRRAFAAVIAGGAVAGVLVASVLGTDFAPSAPVPATPTVKQLGFELMGPHAASLLVVGILLTVALIGATVIASTEARDASEDKS